MEPLVIPYNIRTNISGLLIPFGCVFKFDSWAGSVRFQKLQKAKLFAELVGDQKPTKNHPENVTSGSGLVVLRLPATNGY